MAKKGRPTREPTEAERNQVVELVAKNSPIADIARLLKRSEPNLRKYFSPQLFSEKKARKSDKAPFRITKLLREKVSRYIGCKMPPEDVARVIGCTPEELEKFFPDEIATGHAVTRANVIDHLHDQMEDGTSGATNRLEALTAPAGPGPAAQAPGYVGKKVAANAAASAAASAGGIFAPPSGPKLAVDNTK